MDISLTIAVPIFNAEQTIHRCISSILNQSYQHIEVILVNDGSTDSSAQICDNYAIQDQRVKVFHKKNEGLGSARNVGVLRASSPYVYFMDSDDWIEEDTIKDNLRILEKNKELDILIFGFKKETISSTGRSKTIQTLPPLYKESSDLEFQEWLVDIFSTGCGFSVWNHIFKKSFLDSNKLLFPEYKRGADMSFLFNVYSKYPKIATNPKPYYHYISFYDKGKYNPDSLENHVLYYQLFENIIPSWTKKGKAKKFSVKLFTLWFTHVIPIGIVLNPSFSLGSKLSKISDIYKHPFVVNWLKNYKVYEGRNITVSIMLFIFKIKIPLVQYLFTLIKVFVKRKININHKKFLYH